MTLEMMNNITHEVGDVWRTDEGWKVKLHHGIETFSAKYKALAWKEVFVDNKPGENYNKVMVK